MTYEETLAFLFTQLPVFQRQGPAAYKPDLSNTEALMELVGHPEEGLRCVHVAGTNGKGSVSALVAAALQVQGFKVGLYTSPHLKDFRERIRINGEKIPHKAVVDFVAQYREGWKGIQPSFFEITVAMAFDHFRRESVDIVVLEVGMGGRLDSTNVVTPDVSVITNIGLDHTQFLGDTIARIAAEKGGIIKTGRPVVLGDMLPEARHVLEQLAAERGCKTWNAAELGDGIPPSDLKGRYQVQNRQTALMTLRTLKQLGWELELESVVEGFARTVELTGLLGRWQQLGSNPTIIADCAHNADGMKQAMEQLSAYRYTQLHVVLGVVGDKSPEALLAALPPSAQYYFTRADIPRAMDAETLAEYARTFGLRGDVFDAVKSAYSAARLYADKGDLIFIGGSIFVVAEVV